MNTGVKITQGLKVYGLNGFNRLNTLNVTLDGLNLDYLQFCFHSKKVGFLTWCPYLPSNLYAFFSGPTLTLFRPGFFWSCGTGAGGADSAPTS